MTGAPVNLVAGSVNPCKMCMPMGAATALCGVQNCMTILHGSQGCATYIRRHMATHFNEPVDIASSSLTEQGTVFGGEENLRRGLHNLMTLYHPDIIGIATTCLAETIGEDVAAMAEQFGRDNPGAGVTLVPISAPGYGGTQNEGFFRALRALTKQLAADTAPHGGVNVVTPQISPADTRWLKGFLEACGLTYTLLPDLSDNLDGVAAVRYDRLKHGGTPMDGIAAMAGAACTWEFSEFLDDEESPGFFLQERFGVPLVRLPLPVGLRAMDRWLEQIRAAGGTPADAVRSERGRYLDAMVDGHKYCAKARAAVFGEPDFVKAVVSLCCENGIVPSVVATGSACPALPAHVEAEAAACAENVFARPPVVLTGCDFADIEDACRRAEVNLMIGNSDGRRIAGALGIELIRCAFPIHDRVGGQRVRVLGFEGSLSLLDQAANAMLKRTEERFREEAYEAYFRGGENHVVSH
ncbi:MAG: hypothetical protein LBC26_04665 [Oscillospiraceae bacterium]|jgi:nitrogenase molybdenum-iron protein alpha/beta subunit|nr:hypothetical protein [Oscillospiraceae bacterium]